MRLCQRIKSEDILIYTIALEVDDADTTTLMRNCATSQAHFYDLSDDSALSNAFKSIGFEVEDIRLSNYAARDLIGDRLAKRMRLGLTAIDLPFKNLFPDLIPQFPP